MLRVSLLGDFAIQYDNTTLKEVLTPRLQSLLAYLLLHRGVSQTRSHLGFIFWPDTSEAQARTNLRNLLYQLRHALPNADDYLDFDGQTLQWRSDSSFSVDVNQFQELVIQSRQGNRESLLQAIELYKGDLFPACYDDWILSIRESLRESYAEILDSIVQRGEDDRDYKQAISFAERALQVDPLRESTYRTLIRLHALNGDRTAALRMYHVCATVLQRELGVTPSATTRAFYEQLMGSDGVASHPKPQISNFSALVGREQAWSRLLTSWQTAITESKPQVACLVGEAGIGKTRLLEELHQWASRQGIRCAFSSCYAAEGQLAYAPITDWLRANPLPPLENVWLAEVARLLPEIYNQHPELQKPTVLLENWQKRNLFEGISRALLGSNKPTLLIIDDLHWCDRDSLGLLHFLLRYDRSAPLLMVAAYRPEEIGAGHALLGTLQTLHLSGQTTDIELEPLDQFGTSQLATQILGKEIDIDDANFLFRETEGNPLFVVESVRAGLINKLSEEKQGINESNSAKTRVLPQKVKFVLEARLSQLSPTASELAKLAAVIGKEFSTNLLQNASGLGEDQYVRSIDELWHHRIIKESGKESYDFSHDKLKEVAYQSMSNAQKRLGHQKVAKAIETTFPNTLDSLNQQLAVHYEQAGFLDQAIRYYLLAARAARQVFANDDAESLLVYALNLIEVGNSKVLLPQLWEELGDIYYLQVNYEHALHAFQSALDSLNEVNPQRQARILRKMSVAKREQRLYQDALDLCSRADVILGDPQEDGNSFLWWEDWVEVQVEKIWAHYWLADWQEMDTLVYQLEPVVQSRGSQTSHMQFLMASCLMNLRKNRYVVSDNLLENSQKALKLSSEFGILRSKLDCQFEVGFLHLWRMELDEAQSALNKALDMAVIAKVLPMLVLSQTYLTITCRFRSQVSEVSNFANQAGKLAQEAHMPDYSAIALANHAWVAWRSADLPEAERLGKEALCIWHQSPLVYPFQWLALFPLIAVAHAQQREGEVENYLESLLEPTQQILPDPLNKLITLAVQSKRTGCVGEARKLADQVLTLGISMGYI
jgi:DNA-binding SARP family transcriptional activator